MQYDNSDPRQLYAFGTSPQEELESRKQGRRLLFDAPPLLRTDGDYFPRSLALHGTREMTRLELWYMLACYCTFSLCLYQLLLGAGYVHGVCDSPLSERGRLKELILWPVPLNTCVYSE